MHNVVDREDVDVDIEVEVDEESLVSVGQFAMPVLYGARVKEII